MTALVIGQKRLSDRSEVLKKKLESFGDFNELGFNLRSNIFQGKRCLYLCLTFKLVLSALCLGSEQLHWFGQSLTSYFFDNHSYSFPKKARASLSTYFFPLFFSPL